MNNLGVLNKLIESYSGDLMLNSKLLIALSIFIFINLITTIINIYSQHVLQTKEKKIFSFTIKEKRRIEIFEEIYLLLDNLSFFDGRSDNAEFLIQIQSTEQVISSHKLFLPKKEQILIYNISDYYKTVLTDHRKKNYENETELFKKLEDEFRK